MEESEHYFNDHGLEYYYGIEQGSECAFVIAELWFNGALIEFHQPVGVDQVDLVDMQAMYWMLEAGDVAWKQIMYN